MLNRNSRVIVPTLGVTALIALAAGPMTSTAAAQQPPIAAGPGVMRPMRNRRNERHPELRRALNNLLRAQQALQAAAHDFAGHREQALDLTQRAIEQTKLAFQADQH